MNGKIPCTVEILTRNNEHTIGRCLESVKDFAEILILDGNSTDRTLEIAKTYHCRIVRQYDMADENIPITDYAEVRNKGLRLSSYDWFMYIDSDEYLSREAAEEIRSIVENSNPSVWVWWQPRKYILNGKIIDCATTYPNQQVRFFHKKYVMRFIKPIHERIVVKKGALVGILRSPEFVPLGAIEELSDRWRRYTEKEFLMYASASRIRCFRAATRQFLLFWFYLVRYMRNFVLCRGTRMPFLYEWKRHREELRLAWFLFQKFILP